MSSKLYMMAIGVGQVYKFYKVEVDKGDGSDPFIYTQDITEDQVDDVMVDCRKAHPDSKIVLKDQGITLD